MQVRTIVRLAMIAITAFFCSLSVSAQTEPTQTAKPAKPKMSHEERQQKRMDDLSRDLSLTPEQRAKFEQTDKMYDDKMKANRADRKEDTEKMREERIKAHRSILNPEQAAKYDQMLADKKAKRDAHQAKKGRKKE